MDLAADFKFAQECEEFKNASEMLRYVAAINPEATRGQFVEAAVAAGYAANSSGNRFRESRAFDVKSYGYTLAKDGHLEGEGL